MKTGGFFIFLAAALWGWIHLQAGKVVSFELLGDLPGGLYDSEALDVSADGSVVVGISHTKKFQTAFRWEKGVMEALVDASSDPAHLVRATCVSADGRVVAGIGEFGEGCGLVNTGFRWKAGVVETFLGFPARARMNLDISAMSVDGERLLWNSVTSEGITNSSEWFAGELKDIPGISRAKVNGLSADGMVLVGSGVSPTSWCEAFIQKDGALTWLGNLLRDGEEGFSEACSVSANGSVVVGVASFPRGFQGFVWEAGVMTGLDFLPGTSPFSCTATDVSDDGSIIVGTTELEEGVYLAVLWQKAWAYAPISLDELLDLYGIDRSGYSLSMANAISANGTTIVGLGHHPDGRAEAFRVQLLDPVGIPRNSPESAMPEGLGM